MIEEKDEDKVEALEIVELVDGQATKTTRIRMTLSPGTTLSLVPQGEPRRFCLEPRRHARYIPKGHRTQARYGPREEAHPAETTGLRFRMK